LPHHANRRPGFRNGSTRDPRSGFRQAIKRSVMNRVGDTDAFSFGSILEWRVWWLWCPIPGSFDSNATWGFRARFRGGSRGRHASDCCSLSTDRHSSLRAIACVCVPEWAGFARAGLTRGNAI
jgi:hypothetical protein